MPTSVGLMKEFVMNEVPSRFEQLWSIEQTAEYLALSTKTLYGWRCRKSGPPSYRLGNKVRYRPEEVCAPGLRPRTRGPPEASRWDVSRCRSGRGD